MLFSVLWILAILVIAGVILYFVNGAPNLDAGIKYLIRAVVIIACVVLVLYFLFGLLGGLPHHAVVFRS